MPGMSDTPAEELVLPGMILPSPGGIGVATPAPKAIMKQPLAPAQVLDLPSLEIELPRSLTDLDHPVTAYLNGLAPSSRRPQLAAQEAIARRSTRVFNAETMPWQRLRRPQVLKIRSLLEESYLPATANRMLSALRGVLRECWHSGLVGMEEYRLAVDVEPVRGESEPRGRDLSAGELHGLLTAYSRPAREPPRRCSTARTPSPGADATLRS
jgi:hypothetical protein